jgi:hypothetical protein
MMVGQREQSCAANAMSIHDTKHFWADIAAVFTSHVGHGPDKGEQDPGGFSHGKEKTCSRQLWTACPFVVMHVSGKDHISVIGVRFA